MFGATGGLNDSPACKLCCEAAIALKIPVFVPNLYPFYSVPDGFCEVAPAAGDELEILSDGAELRATADRTVDILSFAGDFIFPTPPKVGRRTRLSLSGLVLDGRGVPEQWSETDYGILRRVGAVNSSAEHFEMRHCKIRNFYGHGVRAIGTQSSTIEHCSAENVGGHWYAYDTYDAFGDAFYHAYAQDGAEIRIQHSPMTGYPEKYSRAGCVFEFSSARYEAIIEDSPIVGYERSVHVEEQGSKISLRIHRSHMSRTRVGLFILGDEMSDARVELVDTYIDYADGDYGGQSLVSNQSSAALAIERVAMRATKQPFLARFGPRTTLRDCIIDWNGLPGAIELSSISAVRTTFRGIRANGSAHTSRVALRAIECRFEGDPGALFLDSADGANWVAENSFSSGPVVRANIGPEWRGQYGTLPIRAPIDPLARSVAAES
ncbi:hypothetical protein ACIQC9_00465 [Brevundimonas sp. NPDC092305]|uniref:hypothetical protein n=1 Tax=Brevundimonas sp. NPDC092305 TaxID=3363957 RepID=UPI0037F6917D